MKYAFIAKQLSLESIQCVVKAIPPLLAAMESAHLPLTAANMVKCNLTPPRLTGREIADDLLSFAKVLPRRLVHRRPTGRKAIEIPPSVLLPLFVFVERTEANREMREDAVLASFTEKERPRGRKSRRIRNVVVNREGYIKEWEEEETKRHIALDVEHYLQECVHERELDLLDARLQAAAEYIQDAILESEIEEKMQRLEEMLMTAASDIDRYILEEEENEKNERAWRDMEARLLDAAGEITLKDIVSEYWSTACH